MFSCEKPPNCLPKWLPFCILTNNERVQVAPHPHPHLMFSVRQIWGLSNGCVVDQFSSVQSLIHVRLLVTPWIAERQDSLSITNSQSLLKRMCIGSVMPSNHLILCHPPLLAPSIFPSIRVFYNESVLHIRWPKYWSFSFNISPSNEHPGQIFRMDWLDLLAVQGTLKYLFQHYSSCICTNFRL